MWIMTAFGALYPCARPAKYIPEGDDRTIQVRARRKEYLEHLNTHYLSGAGEIVSGEEATGHLTDYPWRLYCTPQQLTTALGQILGEVVEDQMQKFKPYTESKRGLKNKALASKLHTVYTTMWSSQLQLTDGTSSYDSWAYYGSGKVPRDPWNCVPRKLGGVYGTHYFLKGQAKCTDCPKQRPRKFKGHELTWDEKHDKLPTTLPPAKRGKTLAAKSWNSEYTPTGGSYCQPNSDGYCTTEWHHHEATKCAMIKSGKDNGLGMICTAHKPSWQAAKSTYVPKADESKDYNDTARWYHDNPTYSPVDFGPGETSKYCRLTHGVCTTSWHHHVPSLSEVGPSGTTLKAAPIIVTDGDGVTSPECSECGEPLDWAQDSNYCTWCGVLVDWDNAAEDPTVADADIPDVLKGVTGDD